MGYKTEKDILVSQIQNLFLMDKLLRIEGANIDEIIDEMPGIFHTNNSGDMTIDSINVQGEEFLQLERDEINAMGMEFFLKYGHPYTNQVVGPRFQKFYEQADDNKVKADFQLMLNPKSNEFEIFFTVTKPFKDKDLLLTNSNQLNKLEFVNSKIERMVGEQLFVRQNFVKFQSLTKREIEILTLLAKGKNNPEIADQLFISRRTVEAHRRNINRKLEIKTFAEVIKFASAFDLI